MIRSISLLFALLVFLGVLVSFQCQADQPQWSDKTRYTNYIREKVALKLAERHNLKIESYGASMRDQVELIFVAFEVDKVLSQDEARKMILDSVNEFVSQINQYNEIQPYLANKPFTHENIAVLFSIMVEGCRRPNPPDFVYVGYHHGGLFYIAKEIQEYDIIDHVTRETYEEAVKRLKQDKE